MTSFIHVHALDAALAAGDGFLVIQGDRLLAGPDVGGGVNLPTRAALVD